MPRSNIKELRQRLHDLKAEGREKLEALNKLNALDDPSDEQLQKIAALDKEVNTIETRVSEAQAAIEVEEKRLDRERSFATFDIPDKSAIQVNEPDPVTTYGFHNIAEFARAVQAASPGGNGVHIDPRLYGPSAAAPSNYHREGGASEGYTVPPSFREQIWELVFSGEDMINWVDREPTASNAVELLADETTPWGSTGVKAYWRAEASQMSTTRLDTDPRMIKLHDLYAFVTATDELLEDAPRLNDRLTRQAARAIRWAVSTAIIEGNGVGKPLGYLSSTAKITVAKESGQAAATISPANILKMYTRLYLQDDSMPFWLANRDIIPQLATMTIGDQPVWIPPGAMTASPHGMLMGYPVRFSEHCETLGAEGDLHLLDMKGYYATQKTGNGRDGEGFKFDSSIHLYFDYGATAFRWTFRFGGQPYLSGPIQPAKGSTTKSCFITLATRA